MACRLQDIGYDIEPEEEISSEWQNSNSKPYAARRQRYSDNDQYGGGVYSYYGNDGGNDDGSGVGNSFRSRVRGVDVVGELLAQMQRTSALLERFVVAATASRWRTPGRRRPTPKNANEQVSDRDDCF